MLALTKTKQSSEHMFSEFRVILIFDKYLNSKISSIPDHWPKDFWQGSPFSLFEIAYLLVELEILKIKRGVIAMIWSRGTSGSINLFYLI